MKKLFNVVFLSLILMVVFNVVHAEQSNFQISPLPIVAPEFEAGKVEQKVSTTYVGLSRNGIDFSGTAMFLQLDGKSQDINFAEVKEVFYAKTFENYDLSTQSPETKKDEQATEEKSAGKSSKKKKSFLFCYGTLNYGLVTWVPGRPLEEPHDPWGFVGPHARPYDSNWGLGIALEYRATDELVLFFDGGMNRWEQLLVKKDGYMVGDWIFEQSGYEYNIIGPFDMDTYYNMDATRMRIGAKYYPYPKGSFQPWVGAAFGAAAWEAVIGNRAEGKKYGTKSSGITPIGGPFLLAGIDFVIDEFVFRIYFDGGSAVAYPKIENLFYTGWTFENTGGEHVTGPYKFGVAIGMAM